MGALERLILTTLAIGSSLELKSCGNNGSDQITDITPIVSTLTPEGFLSETVTPVPTVKKTESAVVAPEATPVFVASRWQIMAPENSGRINTYSNGKLTLNNYTQNTLEVCLEDVGKLANSLGLNSILIRINFVDDPIYVCVNEGETGDKENSGCDSGFTRRTSGATDYYPDGSISIQIDIDFLREVVEGKHPESGLVFDSLPSAIWNNLGHELKHAQLGKGDIVNEEMTTGGFGLACELAAKGVSYESYSNGVSTKVGMLSSIEYAQLPTCDYQGGCVKIQ